MSVGGIGQVTWYLLFFGTLERIFLLDVLTLLDDSKKLMCTDSLLIVMQEIHDETHGVDVWCEWQAG